MSQLINVAFSWALVHLDLPDWTEYGLRLGAQLKLFILLWAPQDFIMIYTQVLALLLAFADVYINIYKDFACNCTT